jgi:hypothetical protein
MAGAEEVAQDPAGKVGGRCLVLHRLLKKPQGGQGFPMDSLGLEHGGQLATQGLDLSGPAFAQQKYGFFKKSERHVVGHATGGEALPGLGEEPAGFIGVAHPCGDAAPQPDRPQELGFIASLLNQGAHLAHQLRGVGIAAEVAGVHGEVEAQHVQQERIASAQHLGLGFE